ncbi:MAG: thioredoxin [Anaerolineales bacterium]
MAAVTELSDGNFDSEVLQAEKPVLVDFTATWCAPCHQIAPIVADIAAEQADTLKVGKLDIDENMDVTMRYGVMAVPTLILFKGGEPVSRLQGFMPKAALMGKLEPHLTSK